MKTTRPPHGRISDHFQGLGAANDESVVQRAREIAITNGRLPNQFTRDDYVQAKRELIGASPQEQGELDTEELTRWDEAPGSSGHSVTKTEPVDEQEIEEELVEEGLNEAEHEQMVEGAKNHRH